MQGHVRVSHIRPRSGPWDFPTGHAHLSSQTQAPDGEKWIAPHVFFVTSRAGTGHMPCTRS